MPVQCTLLASVQGDFVMETDENYQASQAAKKDERASLAAELKTWLIHGPKRTIRNIAVGTGLCLLFSILMFVKLSAAQAYSVSAAFLALAGYAIILGFRD